MEEDIYLSTGLFNCVRAKWLFRDDSLSHFISPDDSVGFIANLEYF